MGICDWVGGVTFRGGAKYILDKYSTTKLHCQPMRHYNYSLIYSLYLCKGITVL